jgi:hypothetical protein
MRVKLAQVVDSLLLIHTTILSKQIFGSNSITVMKNIRLMKNLIHPMGM